MMTPTDRYSSAREECDKHKGDKKWNMRERYVTRHQSEALLLVENWVSIDVIMIENYGKG